MSRILATIICFTLIRDSLSLTDTDKNCIRTYNGTLDNDFLLGSWFKTYKWGMWLNLPSSGECLKTVYSKPDAEELQKYKDFYNDGAKPYNLDDNAILYDEAGLFRGLITGLDEVKFMLLPHNTTFGRPVHGYNAQMFRKIDEEFVLWLNCDLRGTTMWLLSRNATKTDAELDAVIAGIPEVKDLQTQRFCDGTRG